MTKELLETPRLLLRKMDETDLDLIFRLYSDEEIMQYSPFDVMDRKAAQRHLQNLLREWESNREYAVICRQDGRSIGRCHIELDPETDTAMLGCHLIQEEWGKGYASEITRALTVHSFHELGVHRVNALCNPENIGSKVALERNGFRLEAHFVQRRRFVKHGVSDWRDELEYAILREEWQKQQEMD